MKALLVFFILSICVGFYPAHANENELKEITLEGEEYTLMAFDESKLTKENNQRQVDLYNLQKAKFKLINGDLKAAEFYLNKISDRESVLIAIKKRYIATIHFINGRFDKSLKELNDKSMGQTAYYTQNCLLRLINFMTINDLESLNREKDYCRSYTAKFSNNDQFWLDSMIKLKTQNAAGLRKNLLTDIQSTLTDDEMARLWLKTGLYLNKEKDILKFLSILPESAYQSKRLREIIAFMYVRTGETQQALSFVDDIDSANAENIKGNINLINKEYELAFGHFRLALQKKQDSTNSLERAIPLAWLLNQWSDGLSMLNNISNKNLDPRNTSAVRIAFLIREKKFLEAQRELTLLKIAFKGFPPFEVNIMDTYVNLILGNLDTEKNNTYDKRRVEESAEKSCKAFDGMSCWISLQFTQWDNLGKTVKRDDPTYSDKSLTIESLKLKQVITPLAENKTIDQADIEELDGESINVSPK